MHFSQLSQSSQDCIIDTFLDGKFDGELTDQMRSEIAEWARDDGASTTEEVRRILGHDNV